jgi:hypothetical protein
VDVTCVTVDCADPLPVATFWNAALGWGGVAHDPVHDIAICGPSSGGPYLEFVRVPEAKTIKNRLHLGCAVESLEELDVEVERLMDLGATVAWEEEFPPEVAAVYRNLVLRDVEGNEFCLGGGHYPS